MPRRAPLCPACPGSPSAVPLVFGLPSAATFEAADRGEFVLGGCLMEPAPTPESACPKCKRPLG